jgi:hypothetical protein
LLAAGQRASELVAPLLDPVILGNSRRASGTGAIPRRTRSEVGRVLIRSPRYSTVPRVGRTMPRTVFIVVDFPHALPPSRQTISPARIS